MEISRPEHLKEAGLEGTSMPCWRGVGVMAPAVCCARANNPRTAPGAPAAGAPRPDGGLTLMRDDDEVIDGFVSQDDQFLEFFGSEEEEGDEAMDDVISLNMAESMPSNLIGVSHLMSLAVRLPTATPNVAGRTYRLFTLEVLLYHDFAPAEAVRVDGPWQRVGLRDRYTRGPIGVSSSRSPIESDVCEAAEKFGQPPVT